MWPSRIPVGRIAALAALVVGVFALTRDTGALRFRALHRGIEFATIRGEPFCRHGSCEIAVLRLDPTRVRFRVHHFTQEPDRKPIDIWEWQRRTGALAIFNAGQYYPDYSYMGLLVSGGETISARIHPQFKAALVASPASGKLDARVIDLAAQPLDADAPGWREVAQSFMLFDRNGVIRIRKSGQVAHRTVVAQERSGKLLVITSEGSYTLHEFAQLLKGGPLDLSHAMSMDGGHEANLLVRAKGFQYASSGLPRSQPDAAGMDQVPLPTVIAVMAD